MFILDRVLEDSVEQNLNKQQGVRKNKWWTPIFIGFFLGQWLLAQLEISKNTKYSKRSNT